MPRSFLPTLLAPEPDQPARIERAQQLLDAHGADDPDAAAALAAAHAILRERFGLDADAGRQRLTIAPCLPASWGWMEARDLRAAGSVFDVRVRRSGARLTVALRRTGTAPLWIILAPLLDEAASQADVDGQVVRPQVTPSGHRFRCAVEFQAGSEHEVTFSAG